MTFQALNGVDSRETVPSPILDSELKNSDESTIYASESLKNISMSTQGEINMEMVTVVEKTLEGETESSIGETPCIATRTRSYDGQKLFPPLPQHRMNDLINDIKSEM